jgi:hypothetical protein
MKVTEATFSGAETWPVSALGKGEAVKDGGRWVPKREVRRSVGRGLGFAVRGSNHRTSDSEKGVGGCVTESSACPTRHDRV